MIIKLQYSLRLLLGVMFLFSGIAKSFSINSFAKTIHEFHLVPERFVVIPAIAIPAIEITLGLFFVFFIYKYFTEIVSLILMAVFTGAKVFAFSTGLSIECNCFGALNIFNTVSMPSIIFNIWIIFAIFFVSYRGSKHAIFSGYKMFLISTLFFAFIGKVVLDNELFIKSIYVNDIKEVDFDYVLQKSAEENIVVIDARSKIEFDQGHFPDALSIPYNDFSRAFQTYDTIDRNSKIFIYCNNRICGLSRQLAEELVGHGFKKLYVIREGFETWKKSKGS